MKKILLTLFVLALLNISNYTRKEVQAQGFTIDTTVITTNGISIDSTVYAGFRITSNYFGDTTITYEFIFYSDSLSYANGYSPISVNDKTGKYFGFERKTYIQAQFNVLTFYIIMGDAKAILEDKFGKNIK